MIDYIEISGYKSIRDCKLQLGAVNVLIGANGSGKSNFLSFFELFHAIYNQKLGSFSIKKGGSNHLLHKSSKQTDAIRGQIVFNASNGFEFSLVPTEQGKLSISESRVSWNYDKPIEDLKNWKSWEVDKDVLESDLKTGKGQASGVRDYVKRYLSNFGVYHFHDTSPNSPLRSSAKVNDNVFLDADGGNLAAYLYRIQETAPKDFIKIEAITKLVAPFFHSFRLIPNRLNKDQISLEWEALNSDEYFDVSDFSDGTLRFIALSTLLLQPDLPDVIMIDEPELGLHPTAVKMLYELIRKASFSSQIIIATQSVNLLNLFAPEEIITVDQIDGESTFNKLDETKLSKWIEDYATGDLWEKHIIGGQVICHYN